MLPSREERLSALNNSHGKWEQMGAVPQVKLGDNTRTYLVLDDDETIIKTKAGPVGMSMEPDGTSVNPGRTMRHFIDAPHVSYNGSAFHPFTTTQPPSVVNWYKVLDNNLGLDPNIEVLENLWGILNTLAGAL
jgi:hypothetical protein